MNKRIKKKYLSDEEHKILRLYHTAESVQFYRFNESLNNAKSYVSIWGKPKLHDGTNNTIWADVSTYHNDKSVMVSTSIRGGK
ncbi:hypothetical protein [Loigolactobacillus jiayinensis]|uniref:Uncharacterized protein n=1 Tax=Loigolactobacillus jiayinensis TaxID=2486016 RepID=A0ABW1RF66_9LACO|nr:hypothetical protein [Loigolactobacillus jiayinensis]